MEIAMGWESVAGIAVGFILTLVVTVGTFEAIDWWINRKG